MLHLSKQSVLKKNTNNNKNKIQKLWILEFYSLSAKFVVLSPDYWHLDFRTFTLFFVTVGGRSIWRRQKSRLRQVTNSYSH